ncbi:MAG: hypothetical protein ACK5NF_00245 [Bacilli bacterium]
MKEESKVRLLAKSVKTKRIYTIIIATYILMSLPYLVFTNMLFNFLITFLLIMCMLGFYLNEGINKNDEINNLGIDSVVCYQGYVGKIVEVKEKSFIVQSGNNQMEVSKRFCSTWNHD